MNKNYKYYNICKHNYLKIHTELNQSGGKFSCNPKNAFKELCFEKDDGKYKTHKSCINDCENNYINHHLIETGIKGETNKFYLFIKDIIKNEKMDVYIKGGNVIGLKILKMIRDKYKNNETIFREVFEKFLELELIKDWDFAAYTSEPITENYRNKLDKIAKGYKLVPRAKTFILYQTKKPLLTEDKAMFEIAVVDSDAFTKLEIPLTTMKIGINKYNIKYIFMFCKMFMTSENRENIDFDILKRMIDKINIIIHPHHNGLYKVDNKNFDKGKLSDELVDFIDKYSKYDKNLHQFLIIHIEDPFRILYRLPEKNIKKNDKIKNFVHKYIDEKNQSWLFDSEFINKMINKFMNDLGKKIEDTYNDNYKNTGNVEVSLEKSLKILDGISFNRVQSDYKLLTDTGKELLELLFRKLIDTIGEDKLGDIKNATNTISFIKYIASKNTV